MLTLSVSKDGDGANSKHILPTKSIYRYYISEYKGFLFFRYENV